MLRAASLEHANGYVRTDVDYSLRSLLVVVVVAIAAVSVSVVCGCCYCGDLLG